MMGRIESAVKRDSDTGRGFHCHREEALSSIRICVIMREKRERKKGASVGGNTSVSSYFVTKQGSLSL